MRFSAPTGFQRHRALRAPRHRFRRRRRHRGVARRLGRRQPDRAHNPAARATWVIIATAATVVSLSMPFPGHGVTVTERVALALMHLAVAAVLIPALAAILPAQHRSARTDAARYPQVIRPSQPHRAPADPTRHLNAGGSDHQHRPARHADKSEPRLVELLGACCVRQR
jgi:hypothetical protein